MTVIAGSVVLTTNLVRLLASLWRKLVARRPSAGRQGGDAHQKDNYIMENIPGHTEDTPAEEPIATDQRVLN